MRSRIHVPNIVTLKIQSCHDSLEDENECLMENALTGLNLHAGCN